jgi:plastocyanin
MMMRENETDEQRLCGARRLRSMLTASALILACWGGVASAADPVVKIDKFTFAPQTLTIPSGTTVIFENDDHVPHTVVDKGGGFQSKTLETGDKFTKQFTTAGTIEYICSLHPHMAGKIVVTP